MNFIMVKSSVGKPRKLKKREEELVPRKLSHAAADTQATAAVQSCCSKLLVRAMQFFVALKVYLPL